jgi:hypothetical protein
MLDHSLDRSVLAGGVASLKDQYDFLAVFDDVFLELYEFNLGMMKCQVVILVAAIQFAGHALISTRSELWRK